MILFDQELVCVKEKYVDFPNNKSVGISDKREKLNVIISLCHILRSVLSVRLDSCCALALKRHTGDLSVTKLANPPELSNARSDNF